ncbi:MAG: patatin-like phospholipase family protein [Actinomycetota bacterium]|jgi:NTE family protein|nr:patatin-like phospholipase family protein [Actinomycetota bacterium]
MTTQNKHLDPSLIQFLSFQGGGGKGFAYLGALKALAEINKLPNLVQSTNNNILGVAGASAGALTAMMVAIGLPPDDIRESLKRNLIDSLKLGQAFNISRGPSQNVTVTDTAIYARTGVPGVLDAIAELVKWAFPYETILEEIASLVASTAKSDHPLGELLFSEPETAVKVMWSDLGLCAGGLLRSFIYDQLDKLISARGKTSSYSANTLTFAQFSKLTGVRLVVSATNVVNGINILFNEDFPENFPVAEGVAISASFPGIFKPTWIDKAIFRGSSSATYGDPTALQGYWADGGIIDNFPLHAFDSYAMSGSAPNYPWSAAEVNSEELNPTMLGFQLVAGSSPTPNATVTGIQPKDLWLGNYLMDLFGAVTQQNSDGWVRSKKERAQTIQIPVGKLTTTDFSPPPDVIDAAEELGYQATKLYFNTP